MSAGLNFWNARNLLNAGISAGVIFLGVTAIEIFARPGFDITRHAVSVLSLGERGWVMVATFIVSGALTVVCAAGLRYALTGSRGGTWGPLLVALYGLGLILAGIFPAPAGMGFPPGTPDDMQPVMTTTAILHSVAFMVGFTSLIAACFVLARHFSSIGAKAWSLASTAVGLAIPLFIVLGMANIAATGVAFYIGAALGWFWLMAVARKLASPPAVALGAPR